MRMPMPVSIVATSLLMAGVSAPAVAQMSSPPPRPPSAEAPPSPPAPVPPVSQPAGPPPAVMPPAADPNADVPTGAVPPAASGMQPADPNAPMDPTAPVGSPDNPVVVGGNMTAPPATPKNYPKCSKTITDSCINPGEARKMRRR